MAVSFYLDVHVPQPIADQLRRRGVDVITAIEDGWAEKKDHELLEHARELGRVIFTQDDSWRFLQRERQFQLFAYVILENHLHLIASAPDLSIVMQNFKFHAARQIIDLLVKGQR
jgi:hypothetical protein